MIACALLASASVGACALPEGDAGSPEAVHYTLIQARRAGDSAAMWQLLHPDSQAEVSQLAATLDTAAKLIEEHYPEDEQAAALSALTSLERATYAGGDGAKVYAVLAPTEPAPELGGMAKLGARVQSVDERGDRATITTWGGDALEVRRGDGRWHLELSAEQRATLDTLTVAANENKAQLEAHAARIEAWTKAHPAPPRK